jgi:hypothetical protein
MLSNLEGESPTDIVRHGTDPSKILDILKSAPWTEVTELAVSLLGRKNLLDIFQKEEDFAALVTMFLDSSRHPFYLFSDLCMETILNGSASQCTVLVSHTYNFLQWLAFEQKHDKLKVAVRPCLRLS